MHATANDHATLEHSKLHTTTHTIVAPSTPFDAIETFISYLSDVENIVTYHYDNACCALPHMSIITCALIATTIIQANKHT
jgi:hypothetical protein